MIFDSHAAVLYLLQSMDSVSWRISLVAVFLGFGTACMAEVAFDTLSVDVTGVAWGSGANTTPGYVAPKVVASLRQSDGTTTNLVLGSLNWMGKFTMNRRFSKEELSRFGNDVALVDVHLEGGRPEANARIRIENARLFKEEFPPLRIEVTPRERLPFPNRPNNTVPDTDDPRPGDLLADWRADLPSGCQVVRRRIGKSLVVDVTAPAGVVTEVPLGVACEARKVRSFAIPFLTFGERDGRVLADLLEGGWYRMATFDWYVSNASEVYARETEGGRELVARYRPKTDGSFCPVRERIVITLSRDLAETFPVVPNPASPWKSVAGSCVWRSHASHDRGDDEALWRAVVAAGMRHVLVTDHETQWRDGGEPFTFCTDAAAGKGGDAGQLSYARALIEDLGLRYGPYNNFTDLATQSGYFSRDALLRLPDGSLKPAWMRCYAPKPTMMPSACERYAGALKRKFGFNAGYCDVHTSLLPWYRTDYDSRVPGAATYAQTYCSWGETLLLQRRIWDGPVYSEGSHQFMYAGLCDGSYGQDRGYSFATEPWIVDFELRRTHDLATDFGMGSLSMFSPPNTELERMYYLPGAPNGRDALIDSFLAATIAFGHSGYLVLDGCWDPPKPFGPAYGVPCRAKWKECGLPNEALRSYFMIQALAALYTQASAVETRYYDKSGRAYDLSAAVIEGVVGLNRVVTRYSDGTATAVNGGNDGGFEVEIGGRKVVLSSFGYAGSGNGVEVLSTVVDGRRVDFAEGPEYRYREVRGERPEVTLK